MSSDEEKEKEKDAEEVKEPRSLKASDRKNSIRKTLGLPKRKKDKDGKTKKKHKHRDKDKDRSQKSADLDSESNHSTSKRSSSNRSSSNRSSSASSHSTHTHNTNDNSNNNRNSSNSNSSNNNNTDDSSIKLIDVNDSIASDAILASMNSAASIATISGEKKIDRVERVSRDARRLGKGVMKRVRSLSRSRSRRKNHDGSDTDSTSDYSSSSEGGRRPKSTVVTVTSCRSDGYYNQKAPGSTSKLPRKAPTNLKLFHELAVGLKDAFTAVGQTPTKPELHQEITDEASGETRMAMVMSETEFAGRTVLWDFMGNIDFLLALVDEVAVDTATRGALKDDTTFKGLRDVIKKCNKVLEEMLVRRERRYTLFFRLPQPLDTRDMERIKGWNEKVERAVGAVTENGASKDNNSVAGSDSDASSIGSSNSTAKNLIARGRQLLPVAGRVRSRRATPTPRLRKHRAANSDKNSPEDASEDGFAADSPVTQGNLAALQRSFQNPSGGSAPLAIQDADSSNSAMMDNQPQQQLISQAPIIEPKDELVDVIRGLRLEKIQHRESNIDNDLAALKPDWRAKAIIPSAVPKLPTEYIHRHKLMKQVVSCLLEQNGAGPRDVDEESPTELKAIVTSITSRHGDKAGNGKTILAVAAIQTVEVRERFSDGIAWIQLGRGPLSERDIRRLYEELYRQLVVKAPDDYFGDYDYLADSDDENENEGSKINSIPSEGSSFDASDPNGNGSGNPQKDESKRQRLATLAETRQKFQGGELDAIKEDFARLLSKKKVLICLDDVWRVQDAKWFIFDNHLVNGSTKPKKKRRSEMIGEDHEYPSRVLMTTRTPSLLGSGLVQEVFVRILSETEAVKLLLSTGGRRPYGGKNSTVFHQSKLIVKGCGNSPLAVRISGSNLRHSARHWNIKSPAWSELIHQCRLNLEEASQLRSFVNAVNRVVDLSFFTISDIQTRVALRRCFVAFAMAFRDNDWMLSGRGVPHSVVLRVFKTIVLSDEFSKDISPSVIVTMLQNLKLMEHARHGVASRALSAAQKLSIARKQGRSSQNDNDSDSDWDDEDEAQIHKAQQSWVMHESLKSVAEEMAKRSTSCLSPDPDDFTSFSGKIEEEREIIGRSSSLWATPLRFFKQQLGSKLTGFQDNEPHKIVLASLLEVGEGTTDSTSIVDTLREGQIDVAVIPGGDKMEEYIVTFFPGHLMRCEVFTSAAELLSDPHFIARRANALGIIEATSRQVADLQELRRLAGNITLSISRKSKDGEKAATKVDVNSVVREGSRIIIDEICRVANRNESKPDSLGMAMCFAAVGEGLTKSRQPRDGMLRLEEAINLYKELLGPYNIRVADALQTAAKALVKLGESKIALLKFAEAARIYESCNASLQYNSIANAQSLASLLVDLRDMDKAQSMFEEVISMRKMVYGEDCVQVAKTINSYAILLAKHGQMNVALQNYENAKGTYMNVPTPLIRDPEFEIKCKYDVTLINLNIASIRSKKGDLREAITCYEQGVTGLRQYEIAHTELQKDPLRPPDTGKNTAHKHLVAALGRIGSLKLKIGDSSGALQAYTSLLGEVKVDSPSASQTEKAKAHIKCATIYRQQAGPDSHDLSVSHLRQALDMYTSIFGPKHKDTMAISSSLRQWLAEDQNKTQDTTKTAAPAAAAPK